MQIKEMEAFTFKVEILPFAVWFSVVTYRIGLVVLHGLPLNLKFYSEVEHHSAEISKEPSNLYDAYGAIGCTAIFLQVL